MYFVPPSCTHTHNVLVVNSFRSKWLTAWQKTLLNRLVFSCAMRNCWHHCMSKAKLWKFCAYINFRKWIPMCSVRLYAPKIPSDLTQFSLRLKPHKLTEDRFIFFLISYWSLSLSYVSSLLVFSNNKSNESMKWNACFDSLHGVCVCARLEFNEPFPI